ncbi:MAG: Holliday junction resolvase RuvX [Desulfovibrionaceae bacterium]|nr:Holliday junction resolvase RuvX [Desulfovibrionaceae bacterium]
MRALGIDFGLKRVGLAISDPGGVLASPFGTIIRTTRQAAFDQIAAIVEKEKVRAVVVGLPLALDGTETQSTRQARNFAQALEHRLGLAVELMDERLSSAEAEHRLKEAGVCGKKRKQALDKGAAALILQAWLDARSA